MGREEQVLNISVIYYSGFKVSVTDIHVCLCIKYLWKKKNKLVTVVISGKRICET